MADTPDDTDTVASHTLAHLRAHGRKLDLVLETLTRQGERLGRLERDVSEARRELAEVRRDVAEVRRDVSDIRGDVVLVENKILTAQTDVLAILHRLDKTGVVE